MINKLYNIINMNMNKYFLLIFELDSNIIKMIDNFIVDLKKENYNFIYAIISNKNIKINNADIIYINDSKYAFLNVIKQIKLDIDYIVHIKYPDIINYNSIINYEYDDNKFTLSNDINNICCKIIPKKIINTLDYNYYKLNSQNKNCDIINCTNIKYNLNYKFISSNEDTLIKINLSKKSELITIIMTTYNSEKTIHNAIKSILNQTYQNIEFIIVDDGSIDSTVNIINEYLNKDNRIKFFKLNKNYGCYYAKNVALNNINENTKYIAFQDSDDISHISRIYKQYKFMKNNKLLMSTVQFCENSQIKLPMISKMINIIVFNNLGYFGSNKFGEDEHYYYRFFALFSSNFFMNKNNSLFGDYKFYKNLNQILYIVNRHSNSLTATIKRPRIKLSKDLYYKYKHLSIKSYKSIRNVCYFNFNEKYNVQLESTNETYDMLPYHIKQGYVSKSLSHLKDRFLKKYNLVNFYTFNEPCIFFGIYNQDDINILKRTKERYIIWGGTDLNIKYPERLNNLNVIKNININCNYAISSDIENRMIKLKMKYKRIKFSLLDDNYFYPVTITGSNILIYNGINNGNEDIYNKTIYEKIKKKLPQFNYIYSNELKLPNNKMAEIYEKCFIGLRLTDNDGNANMVQEMAYMKIPVVHNGDIKESLKWNSIDDVIDNIYKSIPHFLIIFEKDMNLSDGSTIWLYNFIKLLQKFNSIINITVQCKKVNSNVKFENVNFIDSFIEYSNFNHIFYRFDNNIINFENNYNITLIIHKYNYEMLNYYKKFKFIICNSSLIKDELQFNDIDNVKVLPPLINKIENIKKSNKLTFCYSGTIKKSYCSLEMLELFIEFSKLYDFKFYLIYGKHKLEDIEYDDKLTNIIKKLKNNSKFIIFKDIPQDKINEIIKISHFGLVIHNENIDHMQQSTKLIEYLSLNCMPISYLTYLNCGYINTDLHFKNIIQLKEIIHKILTNKIIYDQINITSKLNNHLIENNINIFKTNNNIYITKNEIKNSDKIVITNYYNNMYFNKNVIYISDSQFNFHSNNIKNIINKDLNVDLSQKLNIETNFSLKNLGNYITSYNDKLFDFNNNCDKLDMYGIIKENDKYYFNSHDNYFEFNCYLDKKFIYFVTLDVTFLTPGVLFILSITDINGSFKDINRNLHLINKKSNKITFSISPQHDSDFIIKIKPSSRNFKPFDIKINQFEIKRTISINLLCDKIKVINMDKERNKFYITNQILEFNGIKCERSIGVDGQNQDILNYFDNYNKISFNETEKNLKRKEIVSAGAIGYLHSMINIFKEAIINNYEYILVFDDDIKIINNFQNKFNDLLKDINYKFRILMLGSSQWEWNNIKFKKNYYYPDSNSNGSFANIYHRSTFDNIYNNIIKLNSPFDSLPMKINFKYNFCYVAYPNLIIAQLEKSNIRKINNNNRNYERFRWDNNLYLSHEHINLKKSKIVYKKINNRLNKKLFIIGITTFNRIQYLKECITSLLKYLSSNIDYIIIVADGNSKDNTQEYIKNLVIPNNVSLYLICNYEHFIYRQSNSIIKLSNEFNFDLGFLINDDVIFISSNWDIYYYNTYIKTKYDHLVFYDINHKNYYHKIKNNLLISYTNATNCQGAFFTFTKKVIEKVGYFDESNFKIRGHSHIDFTIRCCRNNFNNEDYLYDALESSKYIKLNMNNYESSFNKLPLYLRELYKVTLYELERRLNILKDKNRNYINSDFSIEYIN